MSLGDGMHECPRNRTRNEVWYKTEWCQSMLVLVGSTETGRFEHSELINFCPYCGADLRREKK